MEPGTRFERLTVVSYDHTDKWGARMFACRCDCGAVSVVLGRHLRSGNTRSCGCLMREVNRATLTALKTTHGMHGSPTYTSWRSMTQRCTDPGTIGWANYGGRGITVCPEWRPFENFLRDMGIRPEGKTLDRIDNDGNYEKSNCRWATPKEQSYNRRGNLTEEIAVSIRIEAGQGNTTQREIAAQYGVSQSTVSQIVTHKRWRFLQPTKEAA